MKTTKSFLLAFCVIGFPAWADYIPDRLAAVALLNSGSYQSAANAFALLAQDTTLHEVQYADLLSKQALCLQRLNQPTNAMTLAQSIQSLAYSKASQLELLKEGKKWDDIIAQFGQENFAVWPEKLILPAYHRRAEAYKLRGFLSLAELDYVASLNATVIATQKASTAYSIGEMYDGVDAQKALLYYGQVLTYNVRSGGVTQRSLAARARLLTGLGQYEEARAEIAALIAFGSSDPYWKCTIQLASGNVAYAEGYLAKALTFYRAAVAVPSAPAAFVTEAQAKIAALQSQVPTLMGYKTSQTAVILDGDLSKTFWTDRQDSFVALRNLYTGETPTHVETNVSVRWITGTSKLVIGIECIEPQMTNLFESAITRDSPDIYDDDYVEVRLETPNGAVPVIILNPAGSILDECAELAPPGTPELYSVENAAVLKLLDRWTVEIMIDATQLQAQIPSTGIPWNIAINRQRKAGTIPEFYMLSPTGTNPDDLRSFGHLTIKP